MATVKKEKKTTKKEEVPETAPELPEFVMELGLEANVRSTMVGNEGKLHRIASVTFVTPDMTDEQMATVLEKLDACMSEKGVFRVGFYPREEQSGEEENND